MALWLQQLGVVALGCVLAAVMVLLGLWQLRVFHEQGQAASAARAAEPAAALSTVASPGTAVRDGYGRTVSFRCRYVVEAQVLVPLPEATQTDRVLTACRTPEGLVLPVARGTVADGSPVPSPPADEVAQTGLLLPSEDATDAGGTGGTDRLSSVRVPALAQTWPAPLADGYVVLSPVDAQTQGLSPVPVVLPEAQGRLRNGAYALQWWVFAAFAIGMAARIARDLGERTRVVDEPVVDPRR